MVGETRRTFLTSKRGFLSLVSAVEGASTSIAADIVVYVLMDEWKGREMMMTVDDGGGQTSDGIKLAHTTRLWRVIKAPRSQESSKPGVMVAYLRWRLLLLLCFACSECMGHIAHQMSGYSSPTISRIQARLMKCFPSFFKAKTTDIYLHAVLRKGRRLAPFLRRCSGNCQAGTFTPVKSVQNSSTRCRRPALHFAAIPSDTPLPWRQR